MIPHLKIEMWGTRRHERGTRLSDGSTPLIAQRAAR